jgi:hypothetical protein
MVHAAETREAARGELIERWDRDRQASPDDSASSSPTPMTRCANSTTRRATMRTRRSGR